MSDRTLRYGNRRPSKAPGLIEPHVTQHTDRQARARVAKRGRETHHQRAIRGIRSDRTRIQAGWPDWPTDRRPFGRSA